VSNQQPEGEEFNLQTNNSRNYKLKSNTTAFPFSRFIAILTVLNCSLKAS